LSYDEAVGYTARSGSSCHRRRLISLVSYVDIPRHFSFDDFRGKFVGWNARKFDASEEFTPFDEDVAYLFFFGDNMKADDTIFWVVNSVVEGFSCFVAADGGREMADRSCHDVEGDEGAFTEDLEGNVIGCKIHFRRMK
jgi:hypothetical protein